MKNIANNILKLIEFLEEGKGLGLSTKYDVDETLTIYNHLFNERITENELGDTISILLNERRICNVDSFFEVKK